MTEIWQGHPRTYGNVSTIDDNAEGVAVQGLRGSCNDLAPRTNTTQPCSLLLLVESGRYVFSVYNTSN